MKKINRTPEVSGNHIIAYLDNDYNFTKEITYLQQTCHYDDPLDRLTSYANERGIITYGVIRTESRKALWDLEKKIRMATLFKSK